MKEKIKVVHVISNLGQGGAQILLYDIVNVLKRKKNLAVIVITLDSGEYINKFKNEGITVYDLKEQGLINFRIYFKLRKLLKDINPDIVHTHLNKADFYGRISAKRLGIPVIISTCHNYSTHHSSAEIDKKSIFDFIDNFVIRYSGSTLIAISELVKQYLLNRDNTFEKITKVIYNGVNINKENYLLKDKEALNEFRKKISIKNDDFVISVIGRLEKQKGHIKFLNAMRDTLKDNANLKVLIIGDGSLRKEIEDFLIVSELQNSVILTGFVNSSEKYIEISDIIAMPSLWEGFGLVIIESMIKRKIVLASNTGGIPEIITHGENGYLFNTNDPNDLVKKFLQIYSNKNNLDTLKENACQTVKDKFDIEKNSDLYLKFYFAEMQNVQMPI